MEKLYDLASELKQQIETTDPNSMLSVGLVKKAQEIEKLAKQIKDAPRDRRRNLQRQFDPA